MSKWGWGNPYKNYMTNQRGSTQWNNQGYVKRTNQNMKRTEVSKKSRKVVLVHGLFSSPKKFQAYENSLRSKGYQVVTIKHNMPLKPSDHTKVRKFLNRHSDADHFIGHSYGGMAIASHKSIPESKIITLNSPFARRGTNYTMNKDFLNVINPISVLKSEHKMKGDHRTLPHLERLMNEAKMRNYNQQMQQRNRQTQFNRMAMDWNTYTNR